MNKKYEAVELLNKEEHHLTATEKRYIRHGLGEGFLEWTDTRGLKTFRMIEEEPNHFFWIGITEKEGKERRYHVKLTPYNPPEYVSVHAAKSRRFLKYFKTPADYYIYNILHTDGNKRTDSLGITLDLFTYRELAHAWLEDMKSKIEGHEEEEEAIAQLNYMHKQMLGKA